MNRSAGQLASSYAPGRHFAFENGLGVCISQPVPGYTPGWLTASVENQIHSRLNEAFKAWALQGREFLLDGRGGGPEREVSLRKMLVDRSLIDEATGHVEYRPEVIGFLSPSEMAYEPSPLTLVCGRCGLIRTPGNPRSMLALLEEAELRCLHPVKGPNRKANACDWRQFEPIFVHPSGTWRAVSADVLDRDDRTGQTYTRHASCEKCASTDFVVDTTKATLTGWFLRCAKCGVKRGFAWTDHDEEMLSLLDQPGVRREDARMEKISYGAAAAYSVHAETFVNLQATILKCLEEHRSDELKRFIARRTGQFGPLPSPTETADRLAARGLQGNAAAIAAQLRILLTLHDTVDATSKPSIDMLLDNEVRRALDAGLVDLDLRLSPILDDAVAGRRRDWAPRYDPFRLLVEHQALVEVKLSGAREGSRGSFIPFLSPDERLMPWREERGAEADFGREAIKVSLRALGVQEAGLIPSFDLVRFTYGFSRTSSSPRPQRPDKRMPIRLNLFPKTRINGEYQHPVYVLRQMNEAFYFRLEERVVRDWLLSVQCVDAELLDRHDNLAAALLESACATPMDRFLTGHREVALSSDPRQPELYTIAYGLLHSMSHHVIRTVSRLSGLDEGALGEYLFPADMAFVVFRSGMTMDLGDLSSLWRNNWSAFLDELRDYPITLGCGIGSLCAEQGGACPDCLMLPEVCCVAANRYLSRSLLTGDGLPTFADIPGNVLTGFLENAARRAMDLA